MSRDESIYPDPEAFSPERFIKDGGINSEVQDPERFMSGHGRRYVWSALSPIVTALSSPVAATDTCVFRAPCCVCPGKNFAVRMLFTTITCIIATFNIKKVVDEHGNEATPNPEFNPGIIMYVPPFR